VLCVSGVVPGVVVLPGFVDGDVVPEFGEAVPGVGEAVPGVGEAVPGVGEAVPGVGEAVLPELGVVLPVVPGLVPVCPGLDVDPGVCPLCAPVPAWPALDPAEEPAPAPVDPAEPADPAEPDWPVSATTQHVKSNKTAIIEIFVFMGPPSRIENPVDALGCAGRCGRNLPAHGGMSRIGIVVGTTGCGEQHPTNSCLLANVAAPL
jgi:hypothetical protein